MSAKIERDLETQFNLVVAEKDALEAQVAALTKERDDLLDKLLDYTVEGSIWDTKLAAAQSFALPLKSERG